MCAPPGRRSKRLRLKWIVPSFSGPRSLTSLPPRPLCDFTRTLLLPCCRRRICPSSPSRASSPIYTAVSRLAEAPRDRLVISRLSWVQNLSKCSDSEDESDDDLPTMDVDGRPIYPLPGRIALQDAAPVYRTRAAMRAAGLSPVSSPAPVFRTRRSAAASVSSAVAVTVTPAQRHTPRAKGPRATKCQAMEDASSSDSAPVPVPSISSPAAEKLSPASNDNTVPARLQKLLDLGCTLVGSRTVACYFPTCEHMCAYGDMGRHIQIHDRIAAQCFCEGCPRSFARLDSLTCHTKSRNGENFTPERKAFLKNVFEALPLVVRKRVECNYGHPDNLPVQEMNKKLDALFNQLFTAFRKAKA
ncbi:hypothetical protein DFH08DRAFT_487588 [Mycena albidolilacea]|uniref:C2H2-type domain-containing protein n=1 Tax=Mycena albidolilacea TaxID=1033008 RepID=A0AAD6Z5U7_9AGAR|nr:hypothetical protein DFH08DRAFT_487588 [Mycena albidolilacea]